MTNLEEQEKNGDANIWSSILKQVQKTDNKKLASNRTLLVLGDKGSGKNSLVARMANTETPMKGFGLEYNFLEIKDQYREESTKLNVWILDGDLRHASLLKFALTEQNLESCCCVLVASMEEPWNIMDSLQKWADVLENHIMSLNVKSKSSNTDSSKEYTLGVEIIVAITKADHIFTLEKEHEYTEESFDFIQQAVRKFCLQYNASLFYTSSKTRTNCDLLHKYLAHRIYDLPFENEASVVAKDAIFVPAGWDSIAKISILYDNIRSANPDDDYNDVILEPDNPQPVPRESEVGAEDDQTFLYRMQCDIGKHVAPVTAPSSSPSQQRQNISAPSIDGQPPSEGVLQNFFNSLLSNQRTNPNKSQ